MVALGGRVLTATDGVRVPNAVGRIDEPARLIVGKTLFRAGELGRIAGVEQPAGRGFHGRRRTRSEGVDVPWHEHRLGPPHERLLTAPWYSPPRLAPVKVPRDHGPHLASLPVACSRLLRARVSGR
jgi:hypothetical protein